MIRGAALITKQIRPFIKRHGALLIVLLLALGLRFALWEQLPRNGLISDEAEYLAAADWLANGRGLSWYLGWLWTRAPLYPLFLSGHMLLFGHDPAPIFVTQTILSLANIVLIYGLARMLAPRGRPAGEGNSMLQPATIAALLAALYLPFAVYTQLVLSETLFITLLLCVFVSLGRWLAARTPGEAVPWRGRVWLVSAGLWLGLATLTRGLTLGFVPLVVLWAALQARQRRHGSPGKGWPEGLSSAGLLAATCGLLLLPWSLYASRTYGGPVLVDTTGAFNLLLGARTAYDGGRNDEPVRSFVQAFLTPGLSNEERTRLLSERWGRDGDLLRRGACLYEADDPRLLAALARPVEQISQAERQSLMSAEALCLLRAAPGAFVRKSLVELVDLFQINYSGDERLAKGFALGRLPNWYALALFVLDDTIYVLALPLAIVGWAGLRLWKPDDGAHGSGVGPANALAALIGLWLLYNLFTAPLLFVINRFRVPLMPLLFVLAGYSLSDLPGLGRTLHRPYALLCLCLAALLGLVAISPHAYLEPRRPGEDGRWASYLGPYPSSLAATLRALASRAGYVREQELAAALGAGELERAAALLADQDLPPYAAAVGAPLLDGLAGRPAAGLERLATQAVQPLEHWQRSLVAGELLRRSGDLDAARAEFAPFEVDIQNPVAWAWQWLHPPPLPENRIELADDNDLGYIYGFYLGRYDGDLGATLRWATGEAQLRFPAAGDGAAQQLCLRLSGLGWPGDLALPRVQVFYQNELLGAVPLSRQLTIHCLPLPAAPAGSDRMITLRAPTFVPEAADLLVQQGPLAGQLRRLAFQLDWAEIRRLAP